METLNQLLKRKEQLQDAIDYNMGNTTVFKYVLVPMFIAVVLVVLTLLIALIFLN